MWTEHASNKYIISHMNLTMEGQKKANTLYWSRSPCLLTFGRACAARVTVLGLCVCLHLFSHYTCRDQAGSTTIPTALAQQGLEDYVAILLKRRHSRDMALKQATKPNISMDRYRFRLSGTLTVLRGRGASARTITRFQ